jgi:hypothetical protein
MEKGGGIPHRVTFHNCHCVADLTESVKLLTEKCLKNGRSRGVIAKGCKMVEAFDDFSFPSSSSNPKEHQLAFDKMSVTAEDS